MRLRTMATATAARAVSQLEGLVVLAKPRDHRSHLGLGGGFARPTVTAIRSVPIDGRPYRRATLPQPYRFIGFCEGCPSRGSPVVRYRSYGRGLGSGPGPRAQCPPKSRGLGPNPYDILWLDDVYVPKPHKFTRFGDSHDPKSYKCVWLGDIHGPKPCKFICFGDSDSHGSRPCKFMSPNHILLYAGFGAIAGASQTVEDQAVF